MISQVTRSARSLAVLLVLGLTGLAACTSVELDKNAAKIEKRDGAGAAGGSTTREAAGAQSGGVSDVAPVVVEQKDPLTDPDSPLAKRSIYFQYDSFVVQPDFQPVVENHARFLTENKGRRVVIEGNTDERGSREYNLALGQKRADAVRRALATLGVDDAQMESISFGEEKPRAIGTDEASMAENRRADLNYR
ncbi:MAG: peptidoglycan-associated lipoprotein Pal [Lautropia sp.]